MPERRAVAVVQLVGLPGAGKSTVGREVARRAPGVVVEFDEVEGATRTRADAWTPERWREARGRWLEAVGAAVARAAAASTGAWACVVVDDTGELRSMRRDVVRAAAHALAHANAVLVPLVAHIRIDEAEAKRRNASRVGPARVPDETIARIAERFDDPADPNHSRANDPPFITIDVSPAETAEDFAARAAALIVAFAQAQVASAVSAHVVPASGPKPPQPQAQAQPRARTRTPAEEAEIARRRAVGERIRAERELRAERAAAAASKHHTLS